jgi:hypothetical protein
MEAVELFALTGHCGVYTDEEVCGAKAASRRKRQSLMR